MPRKMVNHYPVLIAAQRCSQSGYDVVKPDGTIYRIFVYAANSDLYWTKSTDGGFSWSDPILILAGTIDGFAVWYDRWSGINADQIHIAYMESATDDVWYRNLDASTDALGTQISVLAITSNIVGANQCVSIVRARGGNIFVAFDTDGGTEKGFYRATSIGGAFSARTDMTEGADYFLLVPGFAADNQDIMCIFWDRSASEISVKIHDDSANTWPTETSIATGMTSIAHTTSSPQFAVTVDLTNSKLRVIAWTNRDTASATLRCWEVDESAVGSPVTILTSTDDQQCCAISLDTDTNTLFAFYFGKTDGSETVGTATGIYYRTSVDSGATWSAEQIYSSVQANWNWMCTCLRQPTRFADPTRGNSSRIPSLAVMRDSAVLDLLMNGVFYPPAVTGEYGGMI